MMIKLNKKLTELRQQREQLIINTHMVNGAIQLAEMQLQELNTEAKAKEVQANIAKEKASAKSKKKAAKSKKK